MPQPDPENRVAEITHVYTHASTSPCRVTTEAGTQWVMKLRGAGPGPMGLLTEYVGVGAARALGLRVPPARALYLPPDFPWSIGTDEFDGIVQRSYGWNLGIELVPDAVPATADRLKAADPAFLQAMLEVDALLANTDRSAANPNILEVPDGLVAIDFDACLFLRRAARGLTPSSFALLPGHMLKEREGEWPRRPIDPDCFEQGLQGAPAEWFDFIGEGPEALAANLNLYARAWNRAVRTQD